MAITSIVDKTHGDGGLWLSTSTLSRWITVSTSSGADADGVTWKISKDNGRTWGTNAPDFDNEETHMARLDYPTYDEGGSVVDYMMSLDTTDGKNGTEFTTTAQEGDLMIVEWSVTDLSSDQQTVQFRCRHDLTNPPLAAIRVFNASGKSVEIEDGGWINVDQPFFEFTWVDDRSGVDAFSYTTSGNDPDTTEEKTRADPTYDMTSDPDPSN